MDKKKVTECLAALRKAQKHRSENNTKSQLFEQEQEFVLVEMVLKKIPENYSTFIHRYPIPHHWRKATNYETCLIVPDVNKVALSDRELDLEQTKDKYTNMLESAGSQKLVTEILPMRQLRNEFRQPALRKKLASTYDAFLCEKKLLQNKFNFLCRFLGKQFWVDEKNVPAMIDFNVEPKALKQQIEERLSEAAIYQSGKGSTITVCVGTLVQNDKHLVANILATLEKLKELYGNNICALSLKTKLSMAITFYMDLGMSSEIDVSRPKPEEEFEQDDMDFFTNADVKVWKSGKIEIIKRKREGDADKDDDEDEADQDELELIDSINRDDPDINWTRQKVINQPTFKPKSKKPRKKKPRFFEDDKKENNKLNGNSAAKAEIVHE